eukprot:1139058-Pelagomonas_calceolata.AAC.1
MSTCNNCLRQQNPSEFPEDKRTELNRRIKVNKGSPSVRNHFLGNAVFSILLAKRTITHYCQCYYVTTSATCAPMQVTEPTTPVFVRYFNNRNYDSDLGKVTAAKAPHMGMLGPEMLKYVPASSSPNSKPMLISSGEVSGTLSVFEMEMSDTSLYGRNSFGSSELGQDVVMKRIGRYQSGVVDDGSMEIVAFDADTNTVAVVDASDAGELGYENNLTLNMHIAVDCLSKAFSCN